ncbi:NACHT, LRR and PYD domains-containing protein 12-like [Xenia sp. Carnegie-2017]|uniref:NACHT, LRR and PYD domains-containing protein 12-like n=1 Tax=Xenia sp. Carnegie-2017 TaxID=2897299 RepID=UPI001F0432A6|nr:NACHT, LRR and PYD domains-containing protein 12-like [Xenia sp. Carnegie-2017]
MEKCLEHIPWSSFNRLGRIILIVFGSIGFIVSGIALNLYGDTSFDCHNEIISKTKESSLLKNIESKCFRQYKHGLTFKYDVFLIVVFNFGIFLILSIVYGYCVKYRVDHNANNSPIENSNEQSELLDVEYSEGTYQSDNVAFNSSFYIYIVHLVVRFIILSVFVGLLSFAKFPVEYTCKRRPTMIEISLLNHTISTIESENPNADYSQALIIIVLSVNLIVITLTILELFYLTYKACTDKSFKKEDKFCKVYLNFVLIQEPKNSLEENKGECTKSVEGNKDECTKSLEENKGECTKSLEKNKGECTKSLEKNIGECTKSLEENKGERTKILEENKGDLYCSSVFKIHDDFGGEMTEWRNFDNIYVNVIIQAERQLKNAYPEAYNRHEIFHSYLEVSNDAKKLTNVTEIFKPILGEQSTSYPRSILVIGRPGIGKTMLTKKLLYEWKNNRDEFWQDKLVILVKCRDLETCDTTLKKMLKRCDGLKDKHFSQVYEFINTYPKQTVIIIDGLDELFLNRSEFHKTKRPVFKLIKKLVEGETLSDATVLVTSRSTAEHTYGCLNFKRTVEILGFFEDQIKEYVDKFCGKDKNTAKNIYEHIDTSLELKSLCYIPVNSYIVCLTLKESLTCKAEDIPKTITELYNRAIKVLLWKHHPLCTSGEIPRKTDYLIAPLPPELKEDINKIKDIAVSGITEGNLIFEKSSNTAFHEVANCGIFHRIPDAKRFLYCFLHLTIQEFLAAQCIVDECGKIAQFFHDNKVDPKWHLVIQFVAGLVGDKKKLGDIRDTTVEDVEKRFKKWISNLFSSTGDKVLGFLGVKCLNELQNKDVIRSACTELEHLSQEVKIDKVSFTPVDSNALFEFLSECEHITRLSFDDCKFLDNHTSLPIKNYLLNKGAKNLISLTFESSSFGNYFGKHLSEALKSENCKLTKLVMRGSIIGDEGAKYVSEALKSENCKLTELQLTDNNIGDKGVKYLSEALESENCKLTEYVMCGSNMGDEGAKYLSEALKRENCKLTNLVMTGSNIGDEGVKYLSEALKSENCVEYLSEALKSENCKLTELEMNGSNIGEESVKYLSEALESENCRLTELCFKYNQGYKLMAKVRKRKKESVESVESVKYFSEALKSENCKLTKLIMSGSNIGREGAEYLSGALKSENCKLTKLISKKWKRDPLYTARTLDGGRLRKAAEIKGDESILLDIRGKDFVALEVKYHLRYYQKYTSFLKHHKVDPAECEKSTQKPLYNEGFTAICEEYIKVHIIQEESIFYMAKFKEKFVKFVASVENVNATNYKTSRLKQRMKKRFPQPIF